MARMADEANLFGASAEGLEDIGNVNVCSVWYVVIVEEWRVRSRLVGQSCALASYVCGSDRYSSMF